MKLRKVLYFVPLLLLLLVGCSKDEPSPMIEGVWAIHSLDMTTRLIDPETWETQATIPCGFTGNTQSQSTPSTTRLTIGDDRTGHLTWDGLCVNATSFDFEWRINGSDLIMNAQDGDQWTWIITELTSGELTVQYFREIWRRGPVNETITREEYTMLFRRQ